MKRKYMNVVLSEDEFVRGSEFFPLDDNDYENYPYLLEGDAVCEQEAVEAMDTLIRYLYQNKKVQIIYDLEHRNKALAPVREMTMTEIEKALGYKIKLINE